MFSGYKCVNIVEKHSVNHDRGLIVEQCHSEQLKNSFFVNTIIEWNHLEGAVVHAETVEGFKTLRLKLSLPVRYAEELYTVQKQKQKKDVCSVSTFLRLLSTNHLTNHQRNPTAWYYRYRLAITQSIQVRKSREQPSVVMVKTQNISC